MAFYTNEEVPADIQDAMNSGKHRKQAKRKKHKEEQTEQQEGLTRRSGKEKKPWYKRRLLWILIVVLVILGIGLYMLIRTGILLNNISTSEKGLFGQLAGLVRDEELKGESDGRINVAVFGMRGRDEDGNPLPGGSMLTDTNMVISYRTETKEVAMISVPRDLYIEIPEHNYYAKINSAYSIGEQEEKGRGLTLSKDVMEEVTGLPIHYGITADFYAFQEIVDALGGIEITLDKPFYEPTQFTGENQEDFYLDAGTHTFDGETALFYSRARYASSDFDRAKRQQEVLEAIKDKALEDGTLTNASKVRKFLKALEGNIRTDMTLSEMEAFMRLIENTPDSEINKVVFDTSSEGLLVSSKNEAGAYILTPASGNFEDIHLVCKYVFEKPSEEEE